jgi:lysophospholipase L1-like esterase
MYTPFKGQGQVDCTPLLAADGDHPNARGHQVLAAAVLAALRVVVRRPQTR